MKFLLSLVMVVGSVVGIAMCFMNDIIIDSSMPLFNGMDVSLYLGIFLVAVFIGGLSLMFSHDSL
jgi:hypothetical protein